MTGPLWGKLPATKQLSGPALVILYASTSNERRSTYPTTHRPLMLSHSRKYEPSRPGVGTSGPGPVGTYCPAGPDDLHLILS